MHDMGRTKKARNFPVRLCYLLALIIVMVSYMSSLFEMPNPERRRGSEEEPKNDIPVDWPPKAFLQATNTTRFVTTITNYDYADFADNFAQSLLRQNILNFFIIPTDHRAYDLLQPIYPRHVLPVPPGISKDYRHVRNFGSKAFRELTALRPLLLRELLYATNASLLYNDIDMVWRQNAWNIIDMHESDVMLWADGSQQLCSCMMYLEPSEESYDLLREWSKEIKTGHHKNDQPALNAAVQLFNNRSWSVIRDFERFPHGSYYFGRLSSPVAPGEPDYVERRSKAVVVHNNWANNKTVKTERFRQHGLWNLSDAMEEHVKREKKKEQTKD